jgi:hypothetical protein
MKVGAHRPVVNRAAAGVNPAAAMLGVENKQRHLSRNRQLEQPHRRPLQQQHQR